MSVTHSLHEIMKGIEHTQITGGDVEVKGISYDSRTLTKGEVYFALEGENFHGAEFIPGAVERGCSAVVSYEIGETVPSVPTLKAVDSRLALALASSAFYGHPSKELKLVGITGTNGKTSVSHILRHLLQDSGNQTALLGTIGNDYGQGLEKFPLTTPEAPELNRFLRKAVNAGSTHAVMEVSSHSLIKKRTAGLDFDVAVFTNLTHDHLDFHGDFDSYKAAKGMLFEGLKDTAVSILNEDDNAFDYISSVARTKILTYSMINNSADFFAVREPANGEQNKRVKLYFSGEKQVIDSPLTGEFNVYNLLAACAAAASLGVSPSEIAKSLSSLPQIPGRLERIDSPEGVIVLIDYAHTPDALKNAMKAARELVTPSGGKLITLFGCGGDRDVEKRPLMGELSSTLSDLTVITSDNPRSEPPDVIIKDIEKGMKSGAQFRSIEDRRMAIVYSLEEASSGDVVLIAGKGHEDYQEIGGKKNPFSDRDIVNELLKKAE
ncbi:MAG: UDP-N-acetylmuramoyl-L-alanyl-D-glutamate--2,6-diaminopimelate ligase [Candidatus Marinimicrobia bacterium]|nr:UDP-N-acetylmuramoyl-L-alanyl-D-glutamate--2,6-diaminopimelate ligase [Candidatus Neomarinimicrobiota bacterium]